MPRPIGVIQQPGFFEDLLNRMGVNRPLQPFTLDGDVVPVVLVDSGVSFVAAPSPPYRVVDHFSIGSVVAPVINTVLADTGPLPEGAYTLQFIMQAGESAAHDIQWRNFDNTSTLVSLRHFVSTALGSLSWETRFQIENANERVRISIPAAGNVGISYQSSILARI